MIFQQAAISQSPGVKAMLVTVNIVPLPGAVTDDAYNTVEEIYSPTFPAAALLAPLDPTRFVIVAVEITALVAVAVVAETLVNVAEL